MGTYKIKKRKKLKKGMLFSTLFFLFSVSLFIVSAIFVRTYNYSLSKKTVSMNSDIVQLQQANEELKINIKELLNKDIVAQIASDSGLSKDSSKVSYIVDGE